MGRRDLAALEQRGHPNECAELDVSVKGDRATSTSFLAAAPDGRPLLLRSLERLAPRDHGEAHSPISVVSVTPLNAHSERGPFTAPAMEN